MLKRCGFAVHTKLVRRPITLTGCAYVIFNAGYQEDARFVDETNHGWWDDAMQGCTVLQSALRRRLYEDLVALSGHRTAKRIDQVLTRNFPQRLLYMAMQAYLSKRTLLAGEMVGNSIQPTRGIFAKCALGNRRARVVLNDLVGTSVTLPITLAASRPAHSR